MENRISVTDEIVGLRLPADVSVRVTTLCNSLRLASDVAELSAAYARTEGFLAGLLVGRVISEAQSERLVELFQRVERLSLANHAAVAQDQSPLSLDDLARRAEELLASMIRDLARQVDPEFRGKFYGECRGVLQVLRLGEMLDEARREQWSADIYRASLQAADQCEANGRRVDAGELNRQRFQLEKLAERGITPRPDLPY